MTSDAPKPKAKIVITGPESTGKSTLSEELSRHYGWPYVAEFARSYLEEHGPDYDLTDIERMARGQMDAEKAAASHASHFFCDTDLLTYRIWLADKFGLEWPFIEAHLDHHPASFYLLLRPDIPWAPDPLREDPQRRDALFEQYLTEIRRSKIPYAVIDGTGPVRLERAIRAVDTFLKGLE